MNDWGTHFASYSLLHAGTLAYFAVLWVLLMRIGLRLRGSAHESTWRGALACIVLLSWLWANGIQLTPDYFVAAENLPLQICDIAGLLLPIALWSRNRALRAMVYFVGASFSVVAMVAPDVRGGPISVEFWMFWIPHANLTGVALYLVVVEEFRPEWTDCVRSFGWMLLYLLLILPIDLFAGFNYGYVGPDVPNQPAALAWFGDWPWRVPVLVAITATVFAFLQLPWQGRSFLRCVQKPRELA